MGVDGGAAPGRGRPGGGARGTVGTSWDPVGGTARGRGGAERRPGGGAALEAGTPQGEERLDGMRYISFDEDLEREFTMLRQVVRVGRVRKVNQLEAGPCHVPKLI